MTPTLALGPRGRPALILACLALGILGGALVTWVKPVIVIGAFLGLAVGLVLLHRVQWALWTLAATVVLLPFGALRLNVGFNPSFVNLALVALLVAFALDRLGARRVSDPTPPPGAPLALPTLLFAGVSIAAFILGSDYGPLTKDLIRRFVEFLLALSLVWLVPQVARTRAHLVNLARALALGGGVAATLGVVLYALPDALSIRLLSLLRVFDYPAGPGVLRFIRNDPALAQRATGTSIDPNAFGGLLILVAALVIPHLFARRPMLPRRLAWFLAGTMGLALVLTVSRGSMLGLVAAVALIAFLRYRRLFIWLTAALILILVLPWTQDYVAHFFAGVRGEDLATQMRFGEYKDALILIGRHPWLGVGYAGTPDIDLYIGVSSLYLLLAENSGLIGMAAFLGVMAALFVAAYRGWRHADRELQPIILGGAAGLFGVLVAGVFDHYFVNIKFPGSVTLFWLVVALTATAARLARKPAA